MQLRRWALTAPYAFLVACSGGGGSASPVDPGPGPGGSAAVHVVLDTAAGGTSVIQSQAVAAQLRRADGTWTDNLLANPHNMTLAHPSGESEAFELQQVPDGSYSELRLSFLPGTGTAQREDGSHHAFELASNTLAVPFEDHLAHQHTNDSWLSLRHSHPSAPAVIGGAQVYAPGLSGGPAAEDSLRGTAMRVVQPTANGFAGLIVGDDHGLVHVELEAESELYDDHGAHQGSHAGWLGGIAPGDDVYVSGTIRSDGVIRGRSVRSHGNRMTARLVGRITAVDSIARSLEVDVLGTILRGDRSVLQAPEHVFVAVGSAPVHDSRSHQPLAFADLAVGSRIEIDPSSRNGADVVAREIELESRDGAPQQPEIEGLVGSVDLQAGTITVLPRGNDPLVVGGRSVASAVVHCGASAILVRKARSGGSTSPLTLAGIAAGADRIWVRGAVSTNGVIEADWLRVRTNP